MGVVHRDIRPENILCNDSQHFVLADFGHSRHETGETTEINGAFEYMAPEMYHLLQQKSSADIWSLGVLGLDMLYMVPKVLDQDRTFEKMKDRKWINLMVALANHSERPELEKMVKIKPQERSTASKVLRFLRTSPSTQIESYPANVYLIYLIFRELEQFKNVAGEVVRTIAYGFQHSKAQARMVHSMGLTMAEGGPSPPSEGTSSRELPGVYSSSRPLPDEIHELLAASGLTASPGLAEIHRMASESSSAASPSDPEVLMHGTDSATLSSGLELVFERPEPPRLPAKLTPGILQALINQDNAGARPRPTIRSARRSRAPNSNPASRPVSESATPTGPLRSTPGPPPTAQPPRSGHQSHSDLKPPATESTRSAGPSSSIAEPLPAGSQRNTKQLTSVAVSTPEGKPKEKELPSSANPTPEGKRESGGRLTSTVRPLPAGSQKNTEDSASAAISTPEGKSMKEESPNSAKPNPKEQNKLGGRSSSTATRPGADDSGAGLSGRSQEEIAVDRSKKPTKPAQKKPPRGVGFLSSISRSELEATSPVEERQAPVRTGIAKALEAVRASEAAQEEQRKKSQARAPQAAAQERQGSLQMGQASTFKAANKEQQKSSPNKKQPSPHTNTKKEQAAPDPKRQQQSSSSSSKNGPGAPPVSGDRERESATNKEAKASQTARSTQPNRSTQSASSGNQSSITPPKSVNRSGPTESRLSIPFHPLSRSVPLRPTSSTSRFTSSDSGKSKIPESNQSSGSLQSAPSPGLNINARFWFPPSTSWPPKQCYSPSASNSQGSANLPPPPARSTDSQQSELSEVSDKNMSTPRLLEVGGEPEVKHGDVVDDDHGEWQQPRRRGKRRQSGPTSAAQAQGQSQGRHSRSQSPAWTDPATANTTASAIADNQQDEAPSSPLSESAKSQNQPYPEPDVPPGRLPPRCDSVKTLMGDGQANPHPPSVTHARLPMSGVALSAWAQGRVPAPQPYDTPSQHQQRAGEAETQQQGQGVEKEGNDGQEGGNQPKGPNGRGGTRRGRRGSGVHKRARAYF